jgi:hypothetical protein
MLRDRIVRVIAASAARDELRERVEQDLLGYGVDFDSSDVENSLDNYDVRGALDNYHDNGWSLRSDNKAAPAPLQFDAVDDLFERD